MTKTCRKCGTAFADNLTTCPVCKTAIIQETPDDPRQHVTASYAFLKSSLELVSLKSRWLTALLFFLGGFTGAGFFYLQKRTLGWITLGISTLGLSLFGFVFPDLQLGFYVLVALLVMQTIFALYYWFNPDAKDGRGELLK